MIATITNETERRIMIVQKRAFDFVCRNLMGSELARLTEYALPSITEGSEAVFILPRKRWVEGVGKYYEGMENRD